MKKYVYDPLGRVIEKETPPNNRSMFVREYVYGQENRASIINDGSSLRVKFAYDQRGRVIKEERLRYDDSTLTTEIVYDMLGKRTVREQSDTSCDDPYNPQPGR